MTTPTLFVAFSHTLTDSQIENWFTGVLGHTFYHIYKNDNGWVAVSSESNKALAYIIYLREVAPDLQKQMSNIFATATLQEIQSLAKAIVAEAVKVGATHFFLTGEPTLTMWANLIASGDAEEVTYEKYPKYPIGYMGLFTRDWTRSVLYLLSPEKDSRMVCIQSTTERKSIEVTNPDGTVTKTAIFQHVQWREMF